ncbi:DUF3995 domain-containing protein [Streptomyces sp. SKN60]|uniref:DUF3995 domain-containing protein n=1 Tax=Streptomyces sp. SKN60 TaxID=2855506 RepID=UPI002247E122|nr:DUF3995 domain-containing protein [Streptomyces sp. SKN60]MCX2180918.1 DUF3995 domain-containing protein [Streptomyces sp. SKN60]
MVKERMAARGGAVLLGVLALVHVYWATGAVWPAADERGLSLAVLGSVVSFGPAVVLPLAAIEAVGAVCVGVYGWGLGPEGRMARFARLARLGAAVFAGGLLLRGAVGVVWIVAGKDGSGAVFPWLNALAYTPLCLALGWAVARELRR